MNATLLVTGGTGNIGSRVVPLLREAGHDLRILTRHPRCGARHPACRRRHRRRSWTRRRPRRHRGRAAPRRRREGRRCRRAQPRCRPRGRRTARDPHLGDRRRPHADRLFPADGGRAGHPGPGLPWTVLQAAQLRLRPSGRRRHGEAAGAAGARRAPLRARRRRRGRGPPRRTRARPPCGRVADFAGPEVLDVPQLAERLVTATGGRMRRRLPIRIPGAVGRAYRAGANRAR